MDGCLRLSPQETEEPLTPSWLTVPVEMVSQVYPGEVNGLLGVCILGYETPQANTRETSPHPGHPRSLKGHYLDSGVRLCNLLL